MPRRWVPRRLVAMAMAVALLLTSLPLVGPGAVDAGSPIYPDLRAGLPPNIKLRKEAPAPGRDPAWLLRFDGITENHGGVLEIVADLSASRDIHQQLYDRLEGGAMVRREKISTDLLFHPGHNHFHVSNLARYQLLKRSPTGVYRETSDPGTKTSFCILDSMRIDDAAPPSTYSSCNSTRQGLTAGWADLYGWYLPEQFIELGDTRPADGDYALRLTVDPLDKFLESDDTNNTTTAFFAIVDGQTVESSDEPVCAASPTSVAVGERLHVACQHLSPSTTYDVYWSSPSTAPVASGQGDGDGRVTGSFLVPMSTSGIHTVLVIARGSQKQHTTAVQVRTTIAASHASGPVGSRLTIGLTGLTGGEAIAAHMDLGDGTSRKIAGRTAKADGASLFTVSIPSATTGAHTVTVTTSQTRKTFKLPFVVAASLRISPETLPAGSLLYPELRGFGAGEVVTVAIQSSPRRVLRRLTTYATGGIGPSRVADVRLPVNLPPGDYVILARGQTTGAAGYDTLTVTAPRAQAAPTRTPTATATATVTRTASPTATMTAIATSPATETAVPVATETATTIPPDVASPVSIPETPVPEPTTTETPAVEPPTETPTVAAEPTITETVTPTP